MSSLLIIVDFQNDFVIGSLGFEKAKTLDKLIVERIEKAIAENGDIIFTYDTHYEDYLDTLEGKNLPISHCIYNTDGWKLYGETAKYKDKAVKHFEKVTFGSLELGKWLQDKDYDTVELCGLVSNICVLSNAVIVKAALPESEIVVRRALTCSGSEEMDEKCFDIMKGIHINVL